MRPIDPRVPAPGTVLRREIAGRPPVEVKVLADGRFEWKGEKWTSLSTIAKKATGTTWSGFHFFRLVAQAPRGGDAELQRLTAIHYTDAKRWNEIAPADGKIPTFLLELMDEDAPDLKSDLDRLRRAVDRCDRMASTFRAVARAVEAKRGRMNGGA